MKEKLCCTTSTNGETQFFISILEIGWIEPVFLLISPSLCEVLRINEEPTYLEQIEHFEIVNLEKTYALKFFDLENSIVSGDSSELIIKRANHMCRQEHENGKIYSTFEYSYNFTKPSQYLEYCFFYRINNISYLTSFTAFAVEDYE